MKRRALADWGLLILVNAMWAAQYPAYKVASEQMGPLTLTMFCFVFGSLILLPWLAREGRLQIAAFREVRAQPNRRGFLVIGLLGLVPASAFLAWGTERSTASNAAILYLSVPLITALLAWLVLGERMTKLRGVSFLLSLCGVLILSGFDIQNASFADSRFLAGNCLVLAACTSSSLYNVYSKQLLQRVSQIEVLFYGYVMASLVCLVLIPLFEPLSWTSVTAYRPATWTAVLVLSIMSWGVAMVLWMRLLLRLDVSQASASIYLLPFLGVLFSVITLNETVSPAMWIGGSITLIGTLLVTSAEQTTAS